MLIFGTKSKYPENGRPVVGVIRLLSDARRTYFASGKNVGKAKWTAYGAFETPPPGQRSVDNAVTITTQFDIDLADQLIEFQKGTRLLVAGMWQKDAWQSQKKGKDVFVIKADLVVAQPDYSVMENQITDSASEIPGTEEPDDEDLDF